VAGAAPPPPPLTHTHTGSRKNRKTSRIQHRKMFPIQFFLKLKILCRIRKKSFSIRPSNGYVLLKKVDFSYVSVFTTSFPKFLPNHTAERSESILV
jgi:hypothetical protein